MARHILTIKDLGEKASWLLVQQAIGMPEAKMCTNFMADRVAMLIFAENSLPERLCVSAAVRQMSGSVVYEGSRTVWRRELAAFRDQLMPIFSYYVDCLYTYGLAVGSWDPDRIDLKFPVIIVVLYVEPASLRNEETWTAETNEIATVTMMFGLV